MRLKIVLTIFTESLCLINSAVIPPLFSVCKMLSDMSITFPSAPLRTLVNKLYLKVDKAEGKRL